MGKKKEEEEEEKEEEEEDGSQQDASLANWRVITMYSYKCNNCNR